MAKLHSTIGGHTPQQKNANRTFQNKNSLLADRAQGGFGRPGAAGSASREGSKWPQINNPHLRDCNRCFTRRQHYAGVLQTQPDRENSWKLRRAHNLGSILPGRQLGICLDPVICFAWCASAESFERLPNSRPFRTKFIKKTRMLFSETITGAKKIARAFNCAQAPLAQNMTRASSQ